MGHLLIIIVSIFVIYCVAFTLQKAVVYFATKGGLSGCATIIVKAEGDCKNLEHCVICAKATEAKIVILKGNVTESGEKLLSAVAICHGTDIAERKDIQDYIT